MKGREQKERHTHTDKQTNTHTHTKAQKFIIGRGDGAEGDGTKSMVRSWNLSNSSVV